MNTIPPYRIFPLGDSALTVDFGNELNYEVNDFIHAVFDELIKEKPAGIADVVPAYSSISVFYSVPDVLENSKQGSLAFEIIKESVVTVLHKNLSHNLPDARVKKIPVCYDPDFGTDISRLCDEKKMDPEKLIHLHSEKNYRVFMLGFQPGFAYMGPVADLLITARKQIPEKVPAGSVAIAGNQTGIYPFESPGGWHIIGRTPVQLFDKEKNDPVLLNPGDTVQFYPISKDEFKDH